MKDYELHLIYDDAESLLVTIFIYDYLKLKIPKKADHPGFVKISNGTRKPTLLADGEKYIGFHNIYTFLEYRGLFRS